MAGDGLVEAKKEVWRSPCRNAEGVVLALIPHALSQSVNQYR